MDTFQQLYKSMNIDLIYTIAQFKNYALYTQDCNYSFHYILKHPLMAHRMKLQVVIVFSHLFAVLHYCRFEMKYRS